MKARKLAPMFAIGVAVAFGGIAAPSAAASGGYTIVDLGTLGGTTSEAYAVSDNGTVVGEADLPSGDSHAFLYDGNLPVTDLGTLGGPFDFSSARDLNVHGEVVGTSDDVASITQAFSWAGGVFAPLTTGGGLALGINDGDVVVGQFQAANGEGHAFAYNGSFTDIGALLAQLGGTLSGAGDVNESGEVVGAVNVGDFTHERGFRWTIGSADPPTLLSTLDASGISFATDVNDNGEVVGSASEGPLHAVAWDNAGSITDVPAVPPALALGVNNAGQIVGYSSSASGDSHAFLYTGGQLTDLNDVLPSGSPWVLSEAQDINEAGQIVGLGYNGSEYHAFLLSPSTATPVGSNISVSPLDQASSTSPVTLTFANVVAAGTTTLTIQTSGPVPPAGFELGNPAVYYELLTTATFSGQIQVCISYTGSSPALFHHEASGWVNVTSSVANGVVCGFVTSLSPFAVFYPTSSNRPPNVDANGPYFVGEGGSVNVSATGTDPDGDALAYAWDLDGNGTFETTGQTATFSAAALDGPATRTIAVRATDPGGLVATASTTVDVANVAPSVGPIAVPDGPILIGATLSASAPFTDPAPADTHEATWTWGDGTSSAGTIASGSATGSHVYSAPGTYTIAVTITDDEGGAGSASASRAVVYKLCNLYDPSAAVRKGSTVPIKLQLCDASNANLSSSDVVLHAQHVRQISTSATGPLEASSSANPDNDFRYDATLGGTGGYIYNLSTKGLATGTYALEFTAGSNPYVYQARFGVR